mmetsp:Transcript_7663/g.12920  ORF Transcript_7663/g.12920 Transcript_7663/m.12920 type:complete len:155 (-) Transcript_7663:30-494(-)|eukprot:CAMPEP_0114449776 /NCGR_PEP_ID=MMETSP0104-20121206/113_1 /TAXON_ID=37642 ORGANISM="Paraphysomonas imperforata, Strain PA2" /NCGR_SAMPLE_ID=MMETSP0104 /ASSEMBLY_ACC=CAM_ASM_000202 /LENGTH=154 /DNA_ID=CAMNT_0001621885 /DNA_START=1237 /DNA_END=1701 /DNA_ORIENTATION=-
MSNCSVFTEIDTCTKFPGCEFCVGITGDASMNELRVLSASSAAESNTNHNTIYDYYYNEKKMHAEENAIGRAAEPDTPSVSRLLYPKVVPIYLDSITDEDILLNGFCDIGFSGCATTSSSHPSVSSAPCHSSQFFSVASVPLLGAFGLLLIHLF